MESTLWQRLKGFIRDSLTQKFKAFIPGCFMGLLCGKSLLFSGLPAEAITLGVYCLKFFGTILMAFGSGLGTAYGALLVEKYKNKQNVQKKRENGKRNKAA